MNRTIVIFSCLKPLFAHRETTKYMLPPMLERAYIYKIKDALRTQHENLAKRAFAFAQEKPVAMPIIKGVFVCPP